MRPAEARVARIQRIAAGVIVVIVVMGPLGLHCSKSTVFLIYFYYVFLFSPSIVLFSFCITIYFVFGSGIYGVMSVVF
jgi:hypothetical protein